MSTAVVFLILLTHIMMVLAGFVIGYVSGRSTGRKQELAKKITPTCPCGPEHVWGAHKNGGKCTAQILRRKYNVFGQRSGWEYVPCPCVEYHGPKMIDATSFFTPGTVIKP